MCTRKNWFKMKIRALEKIFLPTVISPFEFAKKFQNLKISPRGPDPKTFILNQIRLLLGSPVHGNGSQYKSGI